MKVTGNSWRQFLETLGIRVLRAKETFPQRQTAPVISGLRDALLDVIQDIEEAYQTEGAGGSLATGFAGFDRLTGGARPGELLVVASVPGLGKSVLGLNIAAHVALSGAGAVAVFSMERSRRELTQRLLCSQSGVSLNRVRSGGLSAIRDFPRLQQAAARLSEAPILLDDSTYEDLGELRERIRELKEAHSIKLVVIDSLQLLCGCQGSEERAAGVARELKRWAREFGVVVLVVAQLESPPGDRTQGRPALEDLRECRMVERHADVVALLWRQDFFDARPEDYDPDFSHASLIVVKNRHGAVGEVPLLFRKAVPRFENRALERAN